MTLTPADRQRIREAFQARVGNTALPSGATIDDLCRNLVLAIPVLLDMADDAGKDYRAMSDTLRELTKLTIRQEDKIATLTAQLESDPCP